MPHYTGVSQGPLLPQAGRILMPLQSRKDHSSMNGNVSVLVWHGFWYGMVWYGMVWYGMVWYGMVWYGMVRHFFMVYGKGCFSLLLRQMLFKH